MADVRPFLARAKDQVKRFADYPAATTKITAAEILEDIRAAHAAMYEEFSMAIGDESDLFRATCPLTLVEGQEFALLPATYRKFKSLILWDDDKIVRQAIRKHSFEGSYGVIEMPHARRMRFVPVVQQQEIGTWELEFEAGPIELHYGNPAPYISSAGAGTFTNATKTLTKAGKFTDYTFKAGDIVKITAGTGVTLGRYTIASKVDANSITLTQDIGGANPVDVVFDLYKCDVLVFTDPPTEGQLYKRDNYYTGATAYIVSGPGVDQYVQFSGFSGTGARATIAEDMEFAETPDSTSVYEIRPSVPGASGQFDEIIAWRACLKYRRIRPDSRESEAAAIREIKNIKGDAMRVVIDRNTDNVGPRIKGMQFNRQRAIWGR